MGKRISGLRIWLIAFALVSTARAATVSVYFSPNGGCTDTVVKEVNRAKKSIVFQAYSFTSTPILEALKSAMSRGVKLEVLYDRSQKNELTSLADDLPVPARFSTAKIMHNKVILIDDFVIITGSFNFTANAEKFNAENMLVIRNRKLAAMYRKDFEKLLARSTTK